MIVKRYRVDMTAYLLSQLWEHGVDPKDFGEVARWSEVEALLLQRAQAIAELQAEKAETMRLLTEERDRFSGARQRLSHLEGVRLPHARRQENANGFQRGWHAALSRVSEGDRWEDLAEVVPQPAATVEVPVCEAEALLTARAQAIAQGQAQLEQPPGERFMLNGYGMKCFDAGYKAGKADAARVARAPQPEQEP